MTRGDSRTELVYGEGGEGLLFLEKEYALDIARFREALTRASTWGQLKSRVSDERFRETVDTWVESELDRLLYEGDLEDDDEPKVPRPDADDAFDAEEIWGYSDGDWQEFAPRMMGAWVDEEIIEEHGFYVYPMLNAEYPMIGFDHEEKVVSLLEERGYVCLRDDDLIWKAIWGD